MYVSINDLSFKGQFTSHEQIEACIENLLLTSASVNSLMADTPIRRTRGLGNRPLTPTQTIRDFMVELYSSTEPAKRALQNKILLALISGPFIREVEFNQELSGVIAPCGEAVSQTSIHACVSKESESVEAVISVQESPYNQPDLRIDVGGVMHRLIFNFFTPECCKPLLRVYEANPKHLIRADKKVNGVVHTRMDLDNTAATDCLQNGIQIIQNKYVYGYMNDKWYEFPPHIDGCYHGYPIENPGNNPILNRIIRVFGEPPYVSAGAQFCNFS